MLQLLHELFHLLLAVRAEAACATASASSWASRSGSSNTRRAGATAAASRSSWANRSRSCSRRAGATWLYGPKPPAQLPVQAAMPDPATPAGPVPPLLPVEAAGRSRSCSRRAGASAALAAGGCGLGAGLGLRAGSWAGRWGGGWEPGRGGWDGGPGFRGLGLGAGAEGGAGAGAGGRYVSIPSMSMCFSCFTTVPPAPGCTARSRLRHCQWKLGQPKRIQQHPPGQYHRCCQAAGQTEVNPAAAGRCQCCQSKRLGAYWGLRAGGWAGAGGRELGAGLSSNLEN